MKVLGDTLVIHCKHEARNDEHGAVSREISRSYKLPAEVDSSSIRSHLTPKGVLHITAQKK